MSQTPKAAGNFYGWANVVQYQEIYNCHSESKDQTREKVNLMQEFSAQLPYLARSLCVISLSLLASAISPHLIPSVNFIIVLCASFQIIHKAVK